MVEGGEHGLSVLQDAADVLAGSPARLEQARALVELGSALRRANRRAAAREPLRVGLDMALECGATRLAERGQTELAATGARPRRDRITGRDALTPSEQRIAQMAVDGLSNREIAQALFVTPKTVENHLGHVYRKLEVSGREGLADALERERIHA
jgi:DNA-binding CsgD family transcriptional regulator